MKWIARNNVVCNQTKNHFVLKNHKNENENATKQTASVWNAQNKLVDKYCGANFQWQPMRNKIICNTDMNMTFEYFRLKKGQTCDRKLMNRYWSLTFSILFHRNRKIPTWPCDLFFYDDVQADRTQIAVSKKKWHPRARRQANWFVEYGFSVMEHAQTHQD